MTVSWRHDLQWPVSGCTHQELQGWPGRSLERTEQRMGQQTVVHDQAAHGTRH